MPPLIAYWGAEVLFSTIGVLLCGSVLVLPDFDFIPAFDVKSLDFERGDEKAVVGMGFGLTVLHEGGETEEDCGSIIQCSRCPADANGPEV